MSWTGGTSKAQVNAAETDGLVARFKYDDILRSYGDMFNLLGSITVRANGADLIVRRVAVVPSSLGEGEKVSFAGKAGAWISEINAGWNLGNTL